MRRRAAAMCLAMCLATIGGPAGAQASGSLGNRDNGLNGRQVPGLQGRDRQAPSRELPRLQDNLSGGGAPPAEREAFAAFCRVRSCPGGYAQHQTEFDAYRLLQQQQRREAAEIDLQRQLQQRNQQQ